MLKVLYEDDEIIVVVKPAGVESQAAKRFAPDMVSEVKKHLVINKSCTPGKEPYVGVIHRLDKPVSGVMVYAKTKRAAAALSEQVQSHKMKKIYTAVVYGKPVNTVDNYVDYLVKTPDGNYSQVVDKGITGAKKAELSYEVLKTIDGEENGMPGKGLSLVKVALKTGRHHQIRVQMSAIGCPVYGDARYGGDIVRGQNLSLWAYKLELTHPVSKERMVFVAYPPLTEPWKRFDIAKFVENFADSDGDEDGVPLFEQPQTSDNLD